nr:anti-sigma factor [Serinicoccus profundi]
MNEEEMHEMAFAYAIHALDDDDRQTFEAHLAECPACQRDVVQTQDAVAGLSEDLAVEPPPHLRSVVLDRVAAEASTVTPLAPRRDGRASSETRRREHRPVRWLAAAAAAVVLAGGVWGVSRTLDPDPTSQVLQAADAAEHTADTEDGPVAVVVSDAAGQAVVQLPGNFAAPQSGQGLPGVVRRSRRRGAIGRSAHRGDGGRGPESPRGLTGRCGGGRSHGRARRWLDPAYDGTLRRRPARLTAPPA